MLDEAGGGGNVGIRYRGIVDDPLEVIVGVEVCRIYC
jgi:hypothetical protein